MGKIGATPLLHQFGTRLNGSSGSATCKWVSVCYRSLSEVVSSAIRLFGALCALTRQSAGYQSNLAGRNLCEAAAYYSSIPLQGDRCRRSRHSSSSLQNRISDWHG